ncbi:alpha/beta fold hydrolase [Salinibius halmophilus]|uniref:alpha/beta fold hydrolase n=1 Tax=Salinibius halmophilus TaxID=1853216 RepID=UPI000E670AD6|nr:alpha/beta fold hydrolase [Salinibius halmophilus]
MLTRVAKTGSKPYLWVPGFAYDWRIFNQAIATRPGEHWATQWSAELDLHSYCEQILAAMPENCAVTGWSLGGAVAMQLIPKSCSTTVLACGQRFCHPQGISNAALRAFKRLLARSPEEALARFQTWCDYDTAPQVTDKPTLLNTLDWLEKYEITHWHNARRVYAKQDKLVIAEGHCELVEGGHASVLEHL